MKTNCVQGLRLLHNLRVDSDAFQNFKIPINVSSLNIFSSFHICIHITKISYIFSAFS